MYHVISNSTLRQTGICTQTCVQTYTYKTHTHRVNFIQWQVTVVDNFYTGRKRNVEQWLVFIGQGTWSYIVLNPLRIGHENFELLNHDVVNPLMIEGML